jgi:hypothetical protein
MDRKLETAEMRIAELEFALLESESAKELWKSQYEASTKQNEELRTRISMAAGIMTEVGLVNSDQTLMLDPADVKVVKERLDRSKHLEIFEAANRANPMVNDAWNKYLMALRLCGFDNTNTESES